MSVIIIHFIYDDEGPFCLKKSFLKKKTPLSRNSPAPRFLDDPKKNEKSAPTLNGHFS